MERPGKTVNRIERIGIENFKSVRRCDLELGNLNVLIGANGAGKSNFFTALRMLSAIVNSRLPWFVDKQGGPDALLRFGRKHSPRMALTVRTVNGEADWTRYSCTLEPTNDNRLMIVGEDYAKADGSAMRLPEENGDARAWAAMRNTDTHRANFLISLPGDIQVFHFQDTGDEARVKQPQETNHNANLFTDAANLAPFLYRLRETHPGHFRMIEETVALAAPFFGGFHLRPNPINPNVIQMEWLEKGNDVPFGAHLLSDGTLRFICLATLLLQPGELRPAHLVIDEPELGLHPFAIGLLAGMLQSASVETQIIISTQSTDFLDRFDAKDVIVVDRKEDGSLFHRLNEGELASWLEEYSLGELWTMNVIGGRLSP